MTLYFTIVTFIFGIVFGSFFNVVAYRLPKGESLVKPASHCTKCNHQLGASELVPIFSYLFLGGKCKNCKCKISPFYTIFELITGLLFALSYLLFDFSIEFYIAIIFSSMAVIVFISDYQTMIIPDEVLITTLLLLMICSFIKGGFPLLGESLLNGLIAFSSMFLIKILGDFLFKKESMGGGDIKLLFIFGFLLGFKMAIISIFLAAFIALPVSLIILFTKKSNVIPFGPFLCMSALIIYFLQLDFDKLLDMLIKI